MLTSNTTSHKLNQANSVKSERGNKIKILIVEPDIKNLNSISSILKTKYDIYKATLSAHALEILKKQKVAIVITDQALPNDNMRGYELLAYVQKKSPKTIRILMAASLDYQNVKSYLKPNDVFQLCRKPIDQAKLTTLIEQAVEFYLENSGKLNRITQLTIPKLTAPSVIQKIKNAPANPYNSNTVVIKCNDTKLFESIKNSYQGKINFLHAYNRHEAITLLENNVVKSLLFAFEQKSEDADVNFLSTLKQELSHLSIIGLVYKDTISYKKLIELMNHKKILSYLPIPGKVERICQQITIALEEATRLYTYPIVLKWPPTQQLITLDKKGKKNFTAKMTKVADNLISSIKGIIKKKT